MIGSWPHPRVDQDLLMEDFMTNTYCFDTSGSRFGRAGVVSAGLAWRSVAVLSWLGQP